MSKIARWKLEKTKVKVVFRLQFHATHIPQTGWDKLYVSLIPADSGKATAKTNKANVRNGDCKWADPIYETTRLLQDARTKQYDEMLYKLVVAMGSSRSSVLGEVMINLADYVDALKPSTVALPLLGCNSGITLHVTVQLLTSKTGFREFEQQRELREKGLPRTIGYNVCNESAGKFLASTETASDQTDKANARVRIKSESRELPSLEEEVELNEENASSATGFDGSSNTSESLYAEKHDTLIMQEIESVKSTISGDLGGLSLSQSPHHNKGDPSDHRLLAQGNNDWVHGWSSDYSVDNDLAIAYEENSRLKGSLEVAESSISELKLEVSSLQSHADELGVETQKFAQQLAAEIASGEDLAKEVSILKSECSKCKDDLERINCSRLNSHIPTTKTAETYKDQFFLDLQMRWLQGLLVMENKVGEIQNKACLRCHETDVGFLHTDTETLQCVLQDLKQGSTQVISLLNVLSAERGKVEETGASSLCIPERFILENGMEKVDTDLHHLEGALHCLSRPCLVPQESDHISSIGVMEGKICQLLRDLNDSKAERENLARKMDQMECYYEALIQELEESQKQMLGELQHLRSEHSTCLYTISSYKTQMEAMHQDMNEQMLRFAEERRDLDSLNKELERRAITSESALKRARWNHSIAVNQLQKDLELLSFQVFSMFETNDKLVRQAFAEASEPCFQECLKTVHEDNTSLVQEHCKIGGQGYQAEVDVYEKPEKEQVSYLVAPRWNVSAEKNLTLPADLVAERHQNLVYLDSLRCTNDELRGNFSILSPKLDSQEFDMAEFMQGQNQNTEVNKLDDEIPSENLRRSIHLQKGLYWKAEDDLFEIHVMNIELDVFSKALQETLYEASDAFRIMKQKMDEVTQQLGRSTESKDLLMLSLQSALDDAHELRKFNSCCIKKFDDLALQNQVQDEKLESSCNENRLLNQKIMELEKSIMECRGYQSKYETWIMEKTELENLLKQEAVVNCSLKNEVSFVNEELKNVKAEFNELVSDKDDLDKTVTFLQEKLSGLMFAYGEQLKEPFLFGKSLQQELENKNFRSIILQLEKLQQISYEKILQLMQSNKDMEEERDDAQKSLIAAQSGILVMKQQYESDIKDIVSKLNASNAHVERLQLVLEDIANKLKYSSEVEEKYSEQQRELFSKLALIEIELQHVSNENTDLTQKFLDLETVNVELEKTKLTVVDYSRENQALMMSLEAGNVESVQLATELNSLKESLMHMHDELHTERGFRAQLEGTITDLTSQLNEKSNQLLSFDRQKSELEQLKQLASDIEIEKSKICHLLSHSEECLKKADEDFSSIRLQVTNLETQLDEMHEYLLVADVELVLTRSQYQARMQELVQQLEASELCCGKLHMKHLDVMKTLSGHVACEAQFMKENARLLTTLNSLKSDFEASNVQQRVLLNKNNDISSIRLQVTNLETQLDEMHEYLLVADVELVLTRNQYQARMQELVQQLEASELCCGELHMKHLDVMKTLSGRVACEAQYMEENARLLTTLNSLKSDFEASNVQQRVLLDKNNAISAELEEYKAKAASTQFTHTMDKQQQQVEAEDLKHMLLSSEEIIDILMSSRDELEITVIVLRDKLDERNAQISLLEKFNNELMVLRNQHNELTRRLSEQILKTEEFKNLSIHLRALKDKADTECLNARERREPEGASFAMQESLRIAFIREQCETKLQELRNQLYISKKHGEEMLLKLQDALDEVENRKKSEASLIKRNEELSLKILDLESELQTVVSDKREKINAYDRMKAELECTMISLDCCKEEKQKLEASLQECNGKVSRISFDLKLTKERLESSTSPTNMQEGSYGPLACMSSEAVTEEIEQKSPVASVVSRGVHTTPANDLNGNDCPKTLDQDSMLSCEEEEDVCLVFSNRSRHSNAQMNVQSIQDFLPSENALGISRQEDQADLLQNDVRRLVCISDSSKIQSLKSSMSRLHEELDKMKNENLGSLLPEAEHHFHPVLQGLQRELLQLHKANEYLGSAFPLFKEFSDSGNALERVLALEIELAEALQAKEKSDIHFQSSFLKQHNDEEAIFQSFKDINELIKDMLEVKGRYAAVESELKDMHDRYSQLSLQFAEVEGERQKLVMKLKNARTPRKHASLNHTTSASFEDNP